MTAASRRFVSAVALVGLAVLSASCASDQPTLTGVSVSAARIKPPPPPPPPPPPAPPPPSDGGLLDCTPLPEATLMQWVGSAGGTMVLGPHVFVIPSGALKRSTKITARIGRGPGNAIQFGPSGLTFATPAYLTLSYANCNTRGGTTSNRVAYTTDDFVIVEYVASADDASTLRVTGLVKHFSNYAIAW